MLQRILNTEETTYSSDLNEETLKKRIEALFKQRNSRMTGKFTSENEFSAYDDLNVIGWSMPNLRRKSAYLKGEIIQGGKGMLITLKVHPNPILPVFGILAVLGGVIITLRALSNTEDDKFLLIIGLVFILLGLIYYPMSTLLRHHIRNKIVKKIGLNRV